VNLLTGFEKAHVIFQVNFTSVENYYLN